MVTSCLADRWSFTYLKIPKYPAENFPRQALIE